VRLLFSRLHARSQKFRAPAPELAARENGSGETEDLGVAGDAGGGGGLHHGNHALGLMQATRRGVATPRGSGSAHIHEPNTP
jgi:hypothetical protein